MAAVRPQQFHFYIEERKMPENQHKGRGGHRKKTSRMETVSSSAAKAQQGNPLRDEKAPVKAATEMPGGKRRRPRPHRRRPQVVVPIAAYG